ncbi:MAG: hypothetical protein ACRC37_05175 [Lentisphaeria bacterium]
MAKKALELSFIDIVMGADAQTIKSAYEARLKIDEQLQLREEAYRKIAEIEQLIESIIGEEGEFIFPAPPLEVAGYSRLVASPRSIPAKNFSTIKSSETVAKVGKNNETKSTINEVNENKPSENN